MMKSIYLHTGSNLGDRTAHLELARQLIHERIGPVVSASRFFETAAWGIEDQPDFLNQALLIQTQLSAASVIAKALAIESQMGRVRQVKWGQRLIDIDLLFYEDEVIDTEDVKVPHPALQERNFVLQPLMEIAPNYVHPVLQKTVARLAEQCTDELPARVYAPENSTDE